MASTTTMGYAAPPHARLNRTRALGVAGGVLAAASVWVVAVSVLGTQLLIRFGDAAPQTIGVGLVVGASLSASLAAWGLLAVLEWRTSRARTIWTRVAIVVALVSLALPLTAGTTTSAKVTLALMHIAVAAVVIPAMRRGLRTSPRS